jgi:hypothetical protein
VDFFFISLFFPVLSPSFVFSLFSNNRNESGPKETRCPLAKERSDGCDGLTRWDGGLGMRRCDGMDGMGWKWQSAAAKGKDKVRL